MLLSLVILGVVQSNADSAHMDHAAWDALLKRHVVSGLVDYEGFRQDRDELERYVVSLQDVELLQRGSREAQLAFWINAYNANVVKGVLDHDPITSVKEVKGFFDRVRYRVAGRELTLNEIEGEGRALGEWRLHFAVVCASSSCPLLLNEAYVPERLEQQLTAQAVRYLGDPKRGLQVKGDTLWLSKIFQWYTADFVPGTNRLTPEAILKVIYPYIPRTVYHASIHHRTFSRLKFLDYNWSLNAQPR